MAHQIPPSSLPTHVVSNVPGEPQDANLYADDIILGFHVAAAGGADHAGHLNQFGALTGSRHLSETGQLANRFPPVFKPYDRFGRRIDEVEFHPAYHALMATGFNHGISSRPWTHPEGGHVAHCALMFMMSQADPGVTCPMSMTYASIAALKHAPELARVWEPMVMASQYDSRLIPADKKTGVTIGMAMTEKQGGSDVRANTTNAFRVNDHEFRLVGHKWFCSAPMSDAFLTLAHSDAGLSCFLVPRWQPDGERNRIEIQRLKDKLGDRANASAEIEYRHAYALPVGEPGKGVSAIIDMVHHTRFDCAIGATSLMRQSLSLACFHIQHRMAFGKKLVDQPLMQHVVADLALEVEGHMALLFLLAETFDQSVHDQQAAALARSMTPVVKFWTTKRCATVVVEAMECLGGAGYIEEQLMPRLYRQAPLNAIWEGSGNVIALDVLRAFEKAPSSLSAVLSLLSIFSKNDPAFATFCEQIKVDLSAQPIEPRLARSHVEKLAQALTVCALYHRGLGDMAEAYIQTRILCSSVLFGAHSTTLDHSRLIERATVFHR